MTTPIDEAQRLLAEELMGRAGISGVGIGADDEEPCLMVYTSEPGLTKIPGRFAGHRVRIVESGPFRARDTGGTDDGGSGRAR